MRTRLLLLAPLALLAAIALSAGTTTRNRIAEFAFVQRERSGVEFSD